MAAQSPQSYSPEVVQEILAEAIARQSADTFTRDQLLEMAAEMSISPDLLDQVEADWRQRQQQRQQAEAAQIKRRRRFRGQVATYAAVNSGLILLNIACAGTITWAIYPLLGWGAGLCLGGCQKSRISQSAPS